MCRNNHLPPKRMLTSRSAHARRVRSVVQCVCDNVYFKPDWSGAAAIFWHRNKIAPLRVGEVFSRRTRCLAYLELVVSAMFYCLMSPDSLFAFMTAQFGITFIAFFPH